jgi:hypothetical protein
LISFVYVSSEESLKEGEELCSVNPFPTEAGVAGVDALVSVAVAGHIVAYATSVSVAREVDLWGSA